MSDKMKKISNKKSVKLLGGGQLEFTIEYRMRNEEICPAC